MRLQNKMHHLRVPGHFRMLKGSVELYDITIMNMYACSNRTKRENRQSQDHILRF